MRKRHLIVGLAASTLLLGSGIAIAEPFGTSSPDQAPPGTTASARAITLPTGDRVNMLADGKYQFDPAKDRDDMHVVTIKLSGDRLVIPADMKAKIANGDIDKNLFNVDALQRSGYSDARDVKSVDDLQLKGDSAEQDASAKQTTVKGSFSFVDGSVPKSTTVVYVNLDTGKSDVLPTKDGKLEAKLPYGHYSFTYGIDNASETDLTLMLGNIDRTLDSDTLNFKVDGKKAVKQDFATERKGKVTALMAGVSSDPIVDEPGSGVSGDMPPNGTVYAVPQKAPKNHKVKTLQDRRIVGGKGDDSFAYTLVANDDGVPAKGTHPAADKDLARVDANYNAMGSVKNVKSRRFDVPDLGGDLMANFQPVPLNSKRTEFYSGGPDIKWTHYGELASTASDEKSSDVFVKQGGTYKVGSRQNVNWFDANSDSPVSVGPPRSDSFVGVGLSRAETQTQYLAASAALFDTPNADDTVVSQGVKGKMTISKGDKVLATEKTADGAVADELGKDDQTGPYTIEASGTRNVPWTNMGSKSTLAWTVNSAKVPNAEVFKLASPVVKFEADGIKSGYAKAGATQHVDLSYVSGGDDKRPCKDMTFSVSYDEGKNWQKVDIDRDGDSAVASLKSPAKAKSVSVKFTASDDKGQSVTHSTINSYGLK